MDDSQSMNDFWQNEDIIIEAKEEYNAFHGDEDLYERDLKQTLLSELPVEKQSSEFHQSRIMEQVAEIMELRQMAFKINETEYQQKLLSDYSSGYFNKKWIIPIVANRKKVYRKINIGADTEGIMDEQITAEQKQITYMAHLDKEIKEETELIEEYKKGVINYSKFTKLQYSISDPFTSLADATNSEVVVKGHAMETVKDFEYLRFANHDNAKWNTRITLGPFDIILEKDDENRPKNIAPRSVKARVRDGDEVSVVGFMILPRNLDNIHQSLNGHSVISRYGKVGDITAISKSEKTVITCTNHGLSDGAQIQIVGSNSRPSIDGAHKNIKVLDNNTFLLDVDLSDGDAGDKGEIFSALTLKYAEGNFNEENDNTADVSRIYLFDDEIDDVEYKRRIENIIPNIDNIIKSELDRLSKSITTDNMNLILDRYSLTVSDMTIDQFKPIKDSLENITRKYIKKRQEMDKENVFNKVRKNRGNREFSIDDPDNVYADEYISHSDVAKYYGEYPNFKKDTDSMVARMRWVFSRRDYGVYYYAFVATKIVKEKSYNEATLKIATKEAAEELDATKKAYEREKKKLEFFEKETCEKRILENMLEFKSFKALYETNIYNYADPDKYEDGQLAIVSGSGEESGQIFIRKGGVWHHYDLYLSEADICSIGLDLQTMSMKTIDQMECAFKESCQSRQIMRFKERIANLENLMTELEEQKKQGRNSGELKDALENAERKLQISLIEDIAEKEEQIEQKITDHNDIIKRIEQIKSSDRRKIALYKLIKKDGLLIGKNLYSKKNRRFMYCGHWYYQYLHDTAHDQVARNTFNELMIAMFGTNYKDSDDSIYCNNCGKVIMSAEYNMSVSLSKVSGEANIMHDVLEIEESVVEQVEKKTIAEKSKTMMEAYEKINCTDARFRQYLIEKGITVEQLPKSKEICMRINTFLGKLGVKMRINEFIETIVGVMGRMSLLPDYNKFKQFETIRLTREGKDPSRFPDAYFQDMYINFMNKKKIGYIAARVLVVMQTTMPPQYPKANILEVPFDSFDDEKGIEYMSAVIEKLGLMNLKVKDGTKTIPLERIQEEVGKSYAAFSEMSEVKRLFKKRREYVAKEAVAIKKAIVEIPKMKDVPMVDDNSSYVEIDRRIRYVNYEIRRIIDNFCQTMKLEESAMLMDNSCCLTEINAYNRYKDMIDAHSGGELDKLLEESVELQRIYNDINFMGAIERKYINTTLDVDYSVIDVPYDKESVRKDAFRLYTKDGELRVYNDNMVDMVTEKSEKEILEAAYTDDDFNSLLNTLAKKGVRRYRSGSKQLLNVETGFDIDVEIVTFADRLSKILGRDTQEYGDILKNLGKVVDETKYTEAKDIIQNENMMYLKRIQNLVKYINNYFRKFISIVANNFDRNLYMRAFDRLSEKDRQDMQEFMFNYNDQLSKYVNEENEKIFKMISFDYSADEVSSILRICNRAIYDKEWSKVVEDPKITLCHGVEIAQHILVSQLHKFINQKYSDIELEGKSELYGNRIVANFIAYVLDLIREDEEIENVTEMELKKYKSSIHYYVGSDTMQTFRELSESQKAIKKMELGLGKDDKLSADDLKEDAIIDDSAVDEKLINEYIGKYGDKPTKEQLEVMRDEHMAEQKKDTEIVDDNFAGEGTGGDYGTLDDNIEADDDTGDMDLADVL